MQLPWLLNESGIQESRNTDIFVALSRARTSPIDVFSLMPNYKNVEDIRFAWNELARDEDGMWHYFVFDAIVMFLKNIQPYKRKLSDGTIGRYHSL